MTTPRDLLFISHANPEDNEFARWLTLKLASLGYHAWSDVIRLLGGEDFWRDIEIAIRRHAVKVLYASRVKPTHQYSYAIVTSWSDRHTHSRMRAGQHSL